MPCVQAASTAPAATLALHVLDIMHAVHDASNEGKRIDLTTTCARPAALPMDLREGLLDE